MPKVTLLSTGGGEKSLLYKERVLKRYEKKFTHHKFYNKYMDDLSSTVGASLLSLGPSTLASLGGPGGPDRYALT